MNWKIVTTYLNDNIYEESAFRTLSEAMGHHMYGDKPSSVENIKSVKFERTTDEVEPANNTCFSIESTINLTGGIVNVI